MASLLDPLVLSRAEALGIAAKQVVEGLRVGEHKSPYRGFSVEFAQHREYVPGDDIRHIDWKSYGRSDRYTIKQYEQETNYALHLLVDTSNSMRYGDGAQAKLAYAKLLAASLAYLVVKQRDSVGLRTFDSRFRFELPPSSQGGHVQQICRALEAAEPAEKSSTGPLLESLVERIGRRGIVVVVSDAFDDVGELVAGLRHLRYRGHEVVLAHVLHPDEINFPLDGHVRFVDLEGADQVRTRPHLLRPAYLKVFNEYLGELAHGCRTAQVGYWRLVTDQPLGEVLAKYLMDRLRQTAGGVK